MKDISEEGSDKTLSYCGQENYMDMSSERVRLHWMDILPTVNG